MSVVWWLQFGEGRIRISAVQNPHTGERGIMLRETDPHPIGATLEPDGPYGVPVEYKDDDTVLWFTNPESLGVLIHQLQEVAKLWEADA